MNQSISLVPPAFELIRQHKTCTVDTQILVLKKSAGKLNAMEMVRAFENGIAGDYGKFNQADVQTLLHFIDEFLKEKNASGNYLEQSLLPVSCKISEQKYLRTTREWHQEVNRCFTAFMNGIAETNFHPHIYDRMLIDGLIKPDSCKKYFTIDVTIDNCYDDEILIMINAAKQRAVKDVFKRVKADGFAHVYKIKT